MNALIPFKGAHRCGSCDFQIGAGITGTIIAVAGLAVSIFMGAIWAAMGFALLGAIAIFMTIQGSANNRALQNSIIRLKGVDQTLTKQLRSLQTNTSLLKTTATQLHLENGQLKESQAKWSEQEKTFIEQIKNLSAQKLKLEADLRSLNTASQGLQKQIQEFLIHTLEMGKATEAFKQSESALASTRENLEKTIESLQLGFQGKINELSIPIATAKTASEAIFKHLSEEQEKQKSQLVELSAMNQTFRSTEISFEDQSQKLKEEWETIHKRTEELDKLRAEFTEAQSRMDQEKEAIEQQYLKLKEEEQLIQSASIHMEQLQTPFEGTLEKTKEALEELGKTLAQRQNELRKIDNLIFEKLAELKQVKSEQASAKSGNT